jgi:hypothetical protein
MDQQPIIRIEYYNDSSPEEMPTAYERYLLGIRELDASIYNSIVLDSFSSALRSARWAEQFVNNRKAVGQGRMQWWGESKDRLERNIAGPFRAFMCNTAVIGHVGSKPDNMRGTQIYGIDATGSLSQSLPRDFGEVYFIDVLRDAEGRSFYFAQTEKDDKMFAKSHLGIAEGFEIGYASGYQDLLKASPKDNLKQGETFSMPLHCLIYGDSGAGKSLFASSFPKPMLVLMWDGYDNAVPYLEQGQAGPLFGLGDFGNGKEETMCQNVYPIEEA